VFRLHANKAKKPQFFRFKAIRKKPFFSLIFALSENERRTLGQSLRSVFAYSKMCSAALLPVTLLEAFFQKLYPFIQQLLSLYPAVVTLLPAAVAFLPAACAVSRNRLYNSICVRWKFVIFLGGSSDFVIELKIFLSVNANTSWPYDVSGTIYWN
jgi:hypothetical protein